MAIFIIIHNIILQYPFSNSCLSARTRHFKTENDYHKSNGILLYHINIVKIIEQFSF